MKQKPELSESARALDPVNAGKSPNLEVSYALDNYRHFIGTLGVGIRIRRSGSRKSHSHTSCDSCDRPIGTIDYRTQDGLKNQTFTRV